MSYTVYLRIRDKYVPEMIVNKVTNSKLVYLFSASYNIPYSLYRFYSSTYINNITYLCFRRHGCPENTKNKREAKFREMLAVQLRGLRGLRRAVT
jgi:hypothetical protein